MDIARATTDQESPELPDTSRFVEKKSPSPTGLLLTVIAYMAFISLGLPDAVTGVAWPSIQTTFAVPQHYLGAISVGLCCGYFISGVLAGRLMQRFGIGGLLSLSCLLVTLAMISNFAAQAWFVLVVNGIVWGLGSGAVDSALNAYAANHFAAKHMNWLHSCYSIGAAMGPIAMSFAIVRLQSWRYGYLIVGAAMAGMMITFFLTRARWRDGSRPSLAHHPDVDRDVIVSTRMALASPLVWLQIIAFYLYTGLESLIGQWGFTWLTLAQGVNIKSAAFWISGYFLSIGLGRVITGIIVARLGIDRLIQLSLLTAIVGSGLMVAVDHTLVNCFSLVVLGIGLAAIFPCMMSRTPQRLGPATAAHAVGFQIAAATLGAATLPGATGLAIERFGEGFVAVVAFTLAISLFIIHEVLLRSSRRVLAAHA